MAKYGSSFKDFLYYIKNKKCVINGHSGLKNWRREYSELKSEKQIKLNICGIGDSIMEGQLSGDLNPFGTDYSEYISLGFLGRMRSYFNTCFDDVGRGMIPFHQNPGLWSCSDGWYDAYGFGICNHCRASVTNGSTYEIEFNGTGFTVFGMKYPGLYTFTVQIDDDDPIEFDEYSGEIETYFPFTVDGLEAGDHTALITVTGGAFYFFGGEEIKGTKGVKINNCCKGGTTSNENKANALDFMVDCFQPELTIINHCVNDATSSTPLETYKTNMQTVIDRAKSFGDVLIILTSFPSAYVGSGYQEALKSLALENSCALFDFDKKWGGAHDSCWVYGYTYADTVHPINAGHEDIANNLLKLLTI